MTIFAVKTIKQHYCAESSATEVANLMNAFRLMVNDCVRVGLETGASSMKRLSLLCYGELSKNQKYHLIPSYYRLTAISKAAGILAARKKSERRGFKTRTTYLRKPLLVSCYHFSIENRQLVFSVTKGNRVSIQLTRYTQEAIKGLEVRSFTLTPNSLSISVRRGVVQYNPKSFAGVDRNASNVTYGDNERVIQFNVAKIEQVTKSTKEIVGSFRRNDARIRKLISSKYGKRKKDRVRQILHRVSKTIVQDSKQHQFASLRRYQRNQKPV